MGEEKSKQTLVPVIVGSSSTGVLCLGHWSLLQGVFSPSKLLSTRPAESVGLLPAFGSGPVPTSPEEPKGID